MAEAVEKEQKNRKQNGMGDGEGKSGVWAEMKWNDLYEHVSARSTTLYNIYSIICIQKYHILRNFLLKVLH